MPKDTKPRSARHVEAAIIGNIDVAAVRAAEPKRAALRGTHDGSDECRRILIGDLQQRILSLSAVELILTRDAVLKLTDG